jgi:hypothetical protein
MNQYPVQTCIILVAMIIGNVYHNVLRFSTVVDGEGL